MNGQYKYHDIHICPLAFPCALLHFNHWVCRKTTLLNTVTALKG